MDTRVFLWTPLQQQQLLHMQFSRWRLWLRLYGCGLGDLNSLFYSFLFDFIKIKIQLVLLGLQDEYEFSTVQRLHSMIF